MDMDLVDLDLCVVLPVKALEAWLAADPATRNAWLAGSDMVTAVDVAGHAAFVFRRPQPRPSRALLVTVPRREASVVVFGDDAAVRAAAADPSARRVLAEDLRVPSALLVIGGDLAHADVSGGTPVAGPHRMLDLEPGRYRVELRSIGQPGAGGAAAVISFHAV